MWWNIFVIVFGIIIAFLVGIIALDCHFKQKVSTGNEKKAWKRAFEGWIILFILIVQILLWIND